MDECRIGLAALRHALEEFVAPAVDPADPIAAEQLISGVRYLDFVIERMELIHDRERFELAHATRLVDELVRIGAGELPDALGWIRTAARGRDVLASPDSRVAQMRALTAELRAATRSILTEAAPPLLTRARALVVAASEEMARFERAWYAPLGFDTDPTTLPDLEALLTDLSVEARPWGAVQA